MDTFPSANPPRKLIKRCPENTASGIHSVREYCVQIAFRATMHVNTAFKFHFAQRCSLSDKEPHRTHTFAQKRWPRLPRDPKVSVAAAALTARQRAPQMPASLQIVATGAPM